MLADRKIHAVRRAAGAVLGGALHAVQTVGRTVQALPVVLAGTDVVIRAGEIMPR